MSLDIYRRLSAPPKSFDELLTVLRLWCREILRGIKQLEWLERLETIEWLFLPLDIEDKLKILRTIDAKCTQTKRSDFKFFVRYLHTEHRFQLFSLDLLKINCT